MTHNYSSDQPTETKKKMTMAKPKNSTLSFIRQFARTYVAMHGCALGTMVIN